MKSDIMEQKHKFSKKDIGGIKYNFNMQDKSNQEVLEEWVYRQYDMKHNGTVTIGKVTKYTVTVVDMP